MSDRDKIYEFDVALSYAGEDRAYVDKVANLLRERGVRIFYAEFALSQTWGADLVTFFDDVFRRKARYAMPFISYHYVAKPWTRHERRSAQARSLVEDDTYVLPIRLDDSELPGLLPTVGYLDARTLSVERIVQLTLEKLGSIASGPVEPPRLGVPRTPDDQERLLAYRPDGWEYLLYAGVLAQGKAALEPRWRDHKLGLIRPTGEPLSVDQAKDFLSGAVRVPLATLSNFNKVLSPDVQAEAFGAKGSPGDTALIIHLAESLVLQYAELLDWSDRVRSALVPDEFRRATELTAAIADNVISEFRTFVDHFVADIETLPERLAAPGDQPIYFKFELVLTVDERTVKEHEAELKRLGKRLRRSGR